MTKPSLWKILLCTFCVVGVTFTWTVEIAYGTPFLLSLDLSKELTAIIWLAGPISGLIVQPIVGAVSDTSTFRLGRRRPFILTGGFIVLVSLVCISYSKELASLSSSSDPETIRARTVVIAVTFFYVLDFSLNAVQTSCRSLIVDSFHMDQQSLVNAFASNLGNFTNVFGYFTGYIDLVKYLPTWLGGGSTQMKAICNIGVVVFAVSVLITCLTVSEQRYTPPLSLEATIKEENCFFIGHCQRFSRALTNTAKYIWTSIRNVPLPIKRICHVQLFAWLGWFPFLLYSSTWVSGLYNQEHFQDINSGDWAQGTRAGSFALLMNALVAMTSGFILPWMTNRRYLSLKTVYTGSHLIYGIAMISSYWIRSVVGATVVIGIVGISWACTIWIPFAFVGNYLYLETKKDKTTKTDQHQETKTTDSNIPGSDKHSLFANDSGTITIEAKSSTPDSSSDISAERQHTLVNTGMALGVVNVFVVIPQFLVALIAAFIFMIRAKYMDQAASGGRDVIPNGVDDVVGVAWVLEFGSWMAFVAAALSRRVIDV